VSLIIPGTLLQGGNVDLPLLSNRIATDFDAASSPSATVSWRFLLNGTLQRGQGGVNDIPSGQEWWSAGITANIGQSYDVRCSSIISGPVFTAQAAAVGTYIQMSATRTWTLTQTVPPGDSIVARFQIVATGGSTVLATGRLTFTAQVEIE